MEQGRRIEPVFPIKNSALTDRDIPLEDAPLDDLDRFAHTFYAEQQFTWVVGSALAERTRARWAAGEPLSGSLSELRACLNLERLRGRFSSDQSSAERGSYVRALVREIRARVEAGQTADEPSQADAFHRARDWRNPVATELYPFNYPWQERFPQARLLDWWEGGALYAAEEEGVSFLINDEGTLFDLVDCPDPEEEQFAPYIRIKRFESEAHRTAYIALRGTGP
jgi:hypothetical protein